MNTFTVFLSQHNVSFPFDHAKFIEKFPDSLLTRTLELTHDTQIELDHLLATSEVLQFLSQIQATGHYPYVPIEYKKSFDYLAIDLPDPIYDLKFQEILAQYPDIDLDNLKDPNYSALLNIAIAFEFPGLAEYVFLSYAFR